MKSYNERLNRITHEFIMFAGFAALEGRFRALNNNDGPDDDIDRVSYGFATSGMAVCGARLLYTFGDLVHAAYNDGKNYFYQDQNNNQSAIQSDPLFDQLDKDLKEMRKARQLNIDRISKLEGELDTMKDVLEKQEMKLSKRITELEKENTSFKETNNSQNNNSSSNSKSNFSINSIK